jgi:N-sulfoglucosamine sulfohydrolase
MRSVFIGSVLLLLLSHAATAHAAPNFVIFVADDMNWEDCGAYGHPFIRTPNMDRLAREGMRFDRAYLTCSSCSPSRCSILTGRYPHSTGAGELHLPLPADQTLMSTPLREAGYYTASVGKWHLGQAAESQMDLVQTGGGPSGAEHWVEVLQNRPREKPFFLWLAAIDPHRPYRPGAVDPPHAEGDVIVPPIFPDTPAVRRDLAMYYDEVSRFDEFVGQVVEELGRQEVLEETFIVVISDNGRPFPRCKTTVLEDGVKTPFIVRYPPLVEAGTVTQSLVSVIDIAPTVLELAGLEPIDSFQGVSFTEVLRDPATVCREAAYAEHNWHDYRAFERSVCTSRFRYVRNWLPHLPATPPADAVRSPTYAEMKRLHAAGELWPPAELVFRQPVPEEELYDVLVDPNCLHNLAQDPLYGNVVEAMRAKLTDWQRETDDVFPGEEHLTPDGFDRETGERLPGVPAPHPSLKRSE